MILQFDIGSHRNDATNRSTGEITGSTTTTER
jgi:hypothetical protein